MAGGGEAGPKSPAPAHHPTDPGIRLRPGANSRSPRVPGSGVLPQFRPVCLGDHGVALGTAGGFFGRPARTTPVAARRASSDGNLPGPPSPGEDGRGPAEQQETLGNPESGHRGLGAGRTGPVALAAPAMEEPIFLRKVLCRNYDRTPPQKNGVSSLKAYEETPRCLLAQQFTDRIETLDVVADGFKYHCDRNAE